ncbi:hypothetical protein RclHR1_02150005 [Rhizophagus clarus]|uniref:Uncharacterized protein n=2 Tax=Rhizophagus clarus TaxID=94130 RepID=A0A2Z6RM38_9GLOM|nr:hypothetical protein RclHR1_02150005 [Rhizophagus clarus]
MARRDKKNHTCDRCDKECANPNKLCEHLNRKFKCKPKPVTSPIRPKSPTPKVPRPRSPSPAPLVHIRGRDHRMEKPKPNEVERQDTYDNNARKSGEHLRTWGARLHRRWTEITEEECDLPKTLKECQRLYHDLLQVDDEACENDQEDPEAGLGPSTQTHREGLAPIPQDKVQDIHFEECSVGRDLERPHQNRSLMSKWVGDVPHPEENPAYAFNIPIFGYKYKENPYIPQLISASRQKIKEVYQTELHRKEQIKTAIAVKCSYSCSRREIDGSTYTDYMYLYHRSGMRPILSEGDIDEHITRSVGELDAQVEEALLRGSGYTLEGILTIFIEVYTPKKLANTKCTINSDNKGLIDLKTNKLSENCLQGAIGCYFAHQDGKTKHLERIFRTNNLKPYLEKVKLNDIPMPTPNCSRIFKKIEEINPDISINVWEWNEEIASSRSVIFSKNPKRPHVIYLLALTDITKSEDYNWPSEASLNHHQDYCHGLGEECQIVKLPQKGVNNFMEFKNYGQMMNAPYVIIADFESDNKKCDELYGGSMRKLAEQKANSFCYLVHWIDTNET